MQTTDNCSVELDNRMPPAALLRQSHTLNGVIVFGHGGHIVEVQARATEVLDKPRSLKRAVTMLGMPKGSMRESLDRIAAALATMGVVDSRVSVTVNLAPADLPKSGTSLDLPVAVAILMAIGILPEISDISGDYLFLGELDVHGGVRGVPGALAMAHEAKPGQIVICPEANERECCLLLAGSQHDKCSINPVAWLDDLCLYFLGESSLPGACQSGVSYSSHAPEAPDFSRIRGQQEAISAATLAAAGGHNMLMVGPPGEGKSFLASAIPGILPKLTVAEKVELTRIYSACGELSGGSQAVTRRPMRIVHHSASQSALIGGGAGIPSPGEITLAHLGILFLDELPEFSRAALEALRQPIEQGFVTVSRAGATMQFPSRFTLVAAMNPCPCGYYGTPKCTCTDRAVQKYLSKLSGPLLDRIDLHVDIETLSAEDRFSGDSVASDGMWTSERIRSLVQRARARQEARLAPFGVTSNAAIPGGHVRELCEFGDDGWREYRSTVEGESISTRSMDRLAKVARTAADIADCDLICPQHVRLAAKFVTRGMLRNRK